MEAIMKHTLTLRRFDDMHCHLRLEPLLSAVLPHTAKYAGRAIAMPNTRPRAILNAEDVAWYRGEIEGALNAVNPRPAFQPLMTIEIRDNTTPEMIVAARKAGAVAGKVYPRGVTTNSDEGLSDFLAQQVLETFAAMAEEGMLLLLHGELDKENVLVTQREAEFLGILTRLSCYLPDLKIVLEHVSSREGVGTVKNLGPNVAATITAHHLCLTLNDVIGYGIQPHHACMPCPKGFSDRAMLIETATSGNRKFFLGSDSAPHLKKNKECARGACGVYTAPVLPAVLAEVFEKAGALDRLEDFSSRFGAEFYRLPLNEGVIILTKESWTVPKEIDGVVPFRAGTELQWKLTE
jgi:dihydroorotase